MLRVTNKILLFLLLLLVAGFGCQSKKQQLQFLDQLPDHIARQGASAKQWVPRLLKTLAVDPERSAFALGLFGADASATVPALVRHGKLSKEAMICALARIGPQSIPHLIKFAEGAELVYKTKALLALGSLRSMAKPAIPILLKIAQKTKHTYETIPSRLRDKLANELLQGGAVAFDNIAAAALTTLLPDSRQALMKTLEASTGVGAIAASRLRYSKLPPGDLPALVHAFRQSLKNTFSLYAKFRTEMLVHVLANFGAPAAKASKDLFAYMMSRQGKRISMEEYVHIFRRLGPNTQKELLRMLDEGIASDRYALIDAMASFGGKAQATLPAMISFLKRSEWQWRAATIRAIQAIAGVDQKDKAACLEPLRKRLKDEDERVKAAASVALLAWGVKDISLKQPCAKKTNQATLIAAFQDLSTAALELVLPTLWRDCPGAAALLSHHLTDAMDRRRPEIATALHKHQDKAIPALLEALTHERRSIRVSAALLLARWKVTNAAPAILKALFETGERGSGARALFWEYRFRRSERDLLHCGKDHYRDPSLIFALPAQQKAVATMLGAIKALGATPAMVFAQLSTRPNRPLGETQQKLLKVWPPGSLLPLLRKWLRSKEKVTKGKGLTAGSYQPFQKQVAAKVLYYMGTDAAPAIPALIAATKSPNSATVSWSLRALGRLMGKDKRAFARVSEIHRQNATWHHTTWPLLMQHAVKGK